MNDRRRTRIVLGGFLAMASACKRDGIDAVAPTAEAPAVRSNVDGRSEVEASPVAPPLGLAVAKVGARLFASSTGDVGFELPPMGVSPGMSVDVVGEQDGRLVVETLVSASAEPRCAATLDGLADFRLRLYVAPNDVLPVPTRPSEPEPEAGDGTVRNPCGEAAADEDVWGGLTGAEVGEAYGVGGLGLVGKGGARRSYEVKAGTVIAWADGRAAGQVTADHRFATKPRDEGGRTCFDAPLSVGHDATTTLCFAPGDVAELATASALGTTGMGTSPGRGFGGRGESVPTVRQAKATVEGSLDKDIIRRIVRAHINEVRACYNEGLARDPALAGRISLDFTIGAAGDVTVVELGDSTLEDAAVADCIAKAVRSFKFPKPEGGGEVRVTYPFVLMPG